MGAVDIWFISDGKMSKSEIEAKIEQKRDQDRSYNGHQEGYSGDWQTINHIAFPGNFFKTKDEAFEYCRENCDKRSGLAVRFKSVDENSIKANKKLLKAEELIKECLKLEEEIYKKITETKASIFEEAKSSKSKSIGCKECGSSINRAHLKSMNCPVCQNDFTSETNKGKLAKLADKREKAAVQLNELRLKYKQIRSDLASNAAGEEKWLVYGVAAC
jgi:hypothetical protein